jgi:RNA polymerase sigma-70 factor (ECF subfamily)
MQEALSKLSEEKREVLVLSRFQGMKYEEIAEITGCKVETIKSRVFRALKDLAKIYKTIPGGEIP